MLAMRDRAVMLAWLLSIVAYGVATTADAQAATTSTSTPSRVTLDDSHFHLTNYVQQGITLREFLGMMGDSIGRVAVFGIPLQQEWMYSVSGTNAPTYYLNTDAPLYYYSFTDAVIATEYLSLPPRDRARFDPMITGFNPGDMYAADHIRRVLATFPGVFTGIGEFSLHKEFVSEKTQPGPASLIDPAIDSVLATAGEIGLIAIVHNDMDVPFPADTAKPAYLDQMKALVRRHPATTIIWAHTGVGRIVRPVRNHAAVLEAMLADPAFANLYFDLSWTEVAKYVVASPEATRIMASLINRYPNRFVFGTDAVAPANAGAYLTTDTLYAPLWAALNADARQKVRVGNYERLFDAARTKVRAWEAAHLSK
jgi:predicted TIM-barrel fold metal-dependent hydrolase